MLDDHRNDTTFSSHLMRAGQIFSTRKGARDAGSQKDKVNNIILYQGIAYS